MRPVMVLAILSYEEVNIITMQRIIGRYHEPIPPRAEGGRWAPWFATGSNGGVYSGIKFAPFGSGDE